MDNTANELASTLQSASMKKHPDPEHDVDPSTSASTKRPVRIENVQPFRRTSRSSDPLTPAAIPISHPDDEIPVSILQPTPRHHNLPPLPDLRFEQSYLARIKTCESPWSIAWVTFFDHIFMPLAQGVVWNLAIAGWRTWNRGVKFQGRSAGARLRRWWWRVNNWKIPAVQDKNAERVREFYMSEFGNAGAD